MNFIKIFTFSILLFSTTLFSQKIIKHKIKSGETISYLAKKYDVSQAELFDLNPKLKGKILALNSEVKIPNKKYKIKEKSTHKDVIDSDKQSETSSNLKLVHFVKPKETLYGISKKYGVTMEQICELNSKLKTESLKPGMTLKLPQSEVLINQSEVNSQDNSIQKQSNIDIDNLVSNVDIVHKVVAKETLYSISKMTGVSEEKLLLLNPFLKEGLKVDQLLLIKKGVVDEKEEKIMNLEIQKEIELSKPMSSSTLNNANLLISKASEHIGTPYRSGGTTKGGFDCSGFMIYTFKNLNIHLPRTSQEMGNYGMNVTRSEAQKGDLIFFATFGKGRISHVGMITEVLEDEIKFIHSSTSSGVIISSTKEYYYARSFVKINRVLTDNY